MILCAPRSQPGLMLWLQHAVFLLVLLLEYASAFAGFAAHKLQLQTCTMSKHCHAKAVQLKAVETEPSEIPVVQVKHISSKKRSAKSALSRTATKKRQLHNSDAPDKQTDAAAQKSQKKVKVYTATALQQLHLTQLLQQLGKEGRWQDVLPAIQAAQNSNLPLNAPICNSGISALGRCGQWQLAVSLLDSMPERGVQPTVISYNAAISACAKVRAMHM